MLHYIGVLSSIVASDVDSPERGGNSLANVIAWRNTAPAQAVSSSPNADPSKEGDSELVAALQEANDKVQELEGEIQGYKEAISLLEKQLEAEVQQGEELKKARETIDEQIKKILLLSGQLQMLSKDVAAYNEAVIGNNGTIEDRLVFYKDLIEQEKSEKNKVTYSKRMGDLNKFKELIKSRLNSSDTTTPELLTLQEALRRSQESFVLREEVLARQLIASEMEKGYYDLEREHQLILELREKEKESIQKKMAEESSLQQIESCLKRLLQLKQ